MSKDKGWSSGKRVTSFTAIHCTLFHRLLSFNYLLMKIDVRTATIAWMAEEIAEIQSAVFVPLPEFLSLTSPASRLTEILSRVKLNSIGYHLLLRVGKKVE